MGPGVSHDQHSTIHIQQSTINTPPLTIAHESTLASSRSILASSIKIKLGSSRKFFVTPLIFPFTILFLCAHSMVLRRFQIIFTLYMTAMLAWFVPAHTRGLVSLDARNIVGSTQKAPAGDPSKDHVADESSSGDACCSTSPGKNDTKGTDQKRRNSCAVCFWAAGVLPVVPVSFELPLLTRSTPLPVAISSHRASNDLPREVLPRGPPQLVG